MSNNMQEGAATPEETQARPASPQLWTARDVARYAQCSLRQVGYLRSEGLPFMRIGRLIRFDPPQVRTWLLGQAPANLPSKEVRL